MKHKQLYNYIREEIISELSLAEASPEELKAKTLSIASDNAEMQELNKQIAAERDPKKKAVLQAQLVVVKQDLVKQQNIKESSLEEMARKANNLKVDNQEKFTAAKDLYEGGWIANLLNFIAEAGEDGISQKDLAEKLGKKDSANINPAIQELKMVKAITTTRIKGDTSPEVTDSEEDDVIAVAGDEETDKEEVEDEEDTFFKVDKEFDAPEEEPKMADIKAVEKDTPKGIDDEKIKAVNAAVAIVNKKVDRIKDIKKKNPKNYKNTNEYIEQMEKLKQFVQKNRSILTKAGTIKNLTDELIS